MDGSCKQKVVALGGPTASGKTALGILLANTFKGEILSADSMQIYKELNVGTAKPTPQERAQSPHHLIDFLDPSQPFSVADYVELAQKTIREIAGRGAQPFVVGGTGLYLSSLLEGIQFSDKMADPALRKNLEEEMERLGPQAMYDRLKALDPQAAAGIHPNNKVRVIRTLEICLSGGETASSQKAQARPAQPPYDSLCLCLGFSDRQILYRRIEDRVDRMVKEGILEEANQVYLHRQEYKTAAQAIGYKEFFPYFEGTASLEEAVNQLKQATRNYAKRQLTWLRRIPGAVWLEADDPRCSNKALEITARFLEQSRE